MALSYTDTALAIADNQLRNRTAIAAGYAAKELIVASEPAEVEIKTAINILANPKHTNRTIQIVHCGMIILLAETATDLSDVTEVTDAALLVSATAVIGKLTSVLGA